MDKHRVRPAAAHVTLVPDDLAGADSVQTASLGPGSSMASADAMHLLVQAQQRNRQLTMRLLAAEAQLAQAWDALRHTQLREREACRRAGEDSLTQLHNQAAFRACVQGALARRRPGTGGLALIYLDLDRFKAVNDQHGHEVGDALLRIVAARLLAALRSGDDVGRMGGDEFACLVANMPDQPALAHLVDKLLLALAAPVHIGTLHLEVRASLGVAVWPADGENGSTLLRHADQAMYNAKRTGGGAVFFGAAARPD